MASVLTQAVQGKSTFQSDEKVVNETITKLFNEREIAQLIGDLNEFEESDGDEEDDDAEEDEENE